MLHIRSHGDRPGLSCLWLGQENHMFFAIRPQCKTDPVLMQDLGVLRFCDMKFNLDVNGRSNFAKGGTQNETTGYVYGVS